MILKVREDFMVCKQRDFIAKWFTVVDFHTLEAMFLLTTTAEKEAALRLCHCFAGTRDFLARPLSSGNRSWFTEKKKRKYFRKLYVPAS